MSEVNDQTNEPIRVNGEVVPDKLIEQELLFLRDRYAQEMSPEELVRKEAKIVSDARENAVERVLLMQQARKLIPAVCSNEVDARYKEFQGKHGGAAAFQKAFEVTPEIESEMKSELVEAIRLERFFDQLCEDVGPPSMAESRAFYDENSDLFSGAEQVRAAHIVQSLSPEVPRETLYANLMNARERLLRGEEFDAVATDVSHCQDGGHDLGWFERGQMVPSFEDQAFSTQVGGVSDVFSTEYGVHLLKVLDRKEAQKRPFEDVLADIEAELYDARKNESIGAVADELRATATIENLVVVDATE